MAYIDDNHDVAAGKGKDPLKELDDELDQLMEELGRMNSDGSQPEQGPAEAAESPEKAPQAPVRKSDTREVLPMKTTRTASGGGRAQPKKKPKKRSKAPVVIAVVLVLGLIGAGIWFAVDRLLQTKISVGAEKPAATETFTDSELGEITVKKVDGAALNTYDINNLVKNDKGYYQYFVDGKAVSEIGIDLAEYQGETDFAAVKNSGVDFVMLRIGGRYYSEEGALYADGMFDTYYEQAKAAGLKVGAYFFSQATDTDEAAEEAAYVVTKLDGRKLDYPVAFDWEIIEDDDARTDNLSGKTITAMAEKFCDTIREKGYQSIVYSSTSLMLQSYDFETMKDYEFWLADYREFPNMYYDFAMWQYATDGSVDGVSGTVDLNICFKPYG